MKKQPDLEIHRYLSTNFLSEAFGHVFFTNYQTISERKT